MAGPSTPRVVSANDLLVGDVVYLAADGGWTRQIDEAAIGATEAEAAALLARAEAQPGAVVGPYLTEVAPGSDGLVPTHFREAFRASGPSIPLPAGQGRSH